MKDLDSILQQAKLASRDVQPLPTATKNAVLRDLRLFLVAATKKILTANARDFSRLPSSYPHTDRLRLTPERIKGMAKSLAMVERLPDPVGRLIDHRVLKTGLTIKRRTVPLGVIGIIYEARPNVTIEVFSLAIKSGNVLVLKGGRDAYETNKVLVSIIHRVLRKHGISPHAVVLLNPVHRSVTEQLLKANQYLDVIIPRGSNRLIEYVRQHTTLPVIETGAGVCHIYVERSANLAWATRTVFNAKTRRVSVCNALDTLVVDHSVARRLLQTLGPKLAQAGVKIYTDQASYKILQASYPRALLHRARASDYGKEFLSLAMSIRVVKDWREGIRHVQRYTSKHSESIITTNAKIAAKFQQFIDAAVVYVNTSIAFTDGYEFGLGGEIGISTQKLHARGPMALQELTTYKWLVNSRGVIRPA
ncbi:MAG: glutamate-5-semialdehyde dehydrogenase [Patescibacteria group bacterium]